MTITFSHPTGDMLAGLKVFFIPQAANFPGPETNGQCMDNVDSDDDGKVNDGCSQIGNDYESNRCDNTTSDDAFDDLEVNDGCPGWGSTTGIVLPEFGAGCDNNIDDDPRDDMAAGVSRVNDGCPAVGPAESGSQCFNNVDNDGDTYVNDGCPAVGGPEPEKNECDNSTDDDFDGYVNDGCVFPPGPIGGPALGAIVGEADVNVTLGINNGACSTNLTVPTIFMNATVDNRLQNESGALPQGSVGPEGPLEPFRDDDDGDGLPRHVDRYPRFVNQLLDPDRIGDLNGDGDEVDPGENPGASLLDPYGTVEPLRPLARYSATQIISGEAWMLQLLVFTPGAFSVFETPHPLSDLASPDLGYPMLILFNDPIDEYGPSDVTDICSPSTTEILLWGKTRDNPCTVSGSTPCATDGALNLPSYNRNDSSGPCDQLPDGYDEAGCVRYANPSAGTHHFYVFQQSQRDEDGDGYENGLDSCPYQANVQNPRTTTGPDGDMLDSACDPTPSVNTGSGNHDGDTLGGSAWENALDNCPISTNGDQKESEAITPWNFAAPRGGSRTDSIGDACDNNPTRADGQFFTVFTDIAKCIGGTDVDKDGWCATGQEPQQPNDPNDNNAARTPEDYRTFVPLPLAHSGSGVNANVGGEVHVGLGLQPQGHAGNTGSFSGAGAGQPYQVCNDGVDNDGDTLVDLLDPGCSPTGLNATDSDGDGWSDEAEIHVGTDALGRCEVGATSPTSRASTDWPGDLISASIPNSTDKLTIADLSSFVAPAAQRHLGTAPGSPNFDRRWDLNPGLPLGGAWINVLDLSTMVSGTTGNPPMSGGVRVFSTYACTAHSTYGD